MLAASHRHIFLPASTPAVVAAAMLLASGCGSGGSAGQAAGPTTNTGSRSEAGVVLTVTGDVYSFTPVALKAKAGSTTIRFSNKGVVEHDFVITALGIKLIAQPGKTTEAVVTLKPGTYESYCSVAGHRQNGMHGTLTVS